MYRPVKITAALLLALGLPPLTSKAGTFNANFDDGATPAGMTLADSAKIVATGGVNNTGYLSLTDALGSLNGTALLDDLDGGNPIGGFTATMKLRIGDGGGQPADGFSISFGPDVQASGGGEEGSGTGLRVILDTYDNAGGEAPALDIAWGGTIFAHTKWTGVTVLTDPPVVDPATGEPASLQTGSTWAPLKIDLHPNGLLDVVYKGIVVFTNLVVPGYTPTAGQFAFSGRTGGSLETHWIDDLSITTVAPITGAATITTQPADTSAPERGNVTFSVVPNGAPPISFQWSTNGVAVQDATGSTLTLSGLTMDLNNLKVKVNVSNAEGAIDSREATLTVTPDTLKPTIVKAQASETFTDVTVLFSEDVDPVSAALKDNYTIAGLTVNSATIVGPRVVKLTTTTQTQGTAYNVVVNNVKDTAATPNTIAANSSAAFTSFAYQTGGLRMDIFTDITGSTVPDLQNAQKFIDNAPDLTYYVRQFSSRPVFGGGVLENYGGRLSGWIVPLETAEYNFFIRSDDLSQLYLSPDEDPAKKALIAEVTACCGAFHEPNVDNPPPDTSAPVLLQKGVRYYIEAIWKEGGGGDYADVAWRKVGDTFAAQALPFIQGNVLETLAPPNSLVPPTITFTAPADNSSIDQTNVPVTLSATAAAAAGKTITKVEFFEQNVL
ncbi:MAG TPA: Ig-like domain-containing protein, partial [Pyrinomonadaceae bacterium]|nr:Ig-like domain-containing protein [Pyrinomonadaceae bacterium]